MTDDQNNAPDNEERTAVGLAISPVRYDPTEAKAHFREAVNEADTLLGAGEVALMKGDPVLALAMWGQALGMIQVIAGFDQKFSDSALSVSARVHKNMTSLHHLLLSSHRALFEQDEAEFLTLDELKSEMVSGRFTRIIGVDEIDPPINPISEGN